MSEERPGDASAPKLMLGPPLDLYVIMAVRNRRQKTLECTQSIQSQRILAPINTHIYVFDDGSTDGTKESLSQLLGESAVIVGDGSNYWARSMAAVEEVVLATHSKVKPNAYIVWMNDDVILHKSAFNTFYEHSLKHPNSVLVGAVQSAQTGLTTYSGFVKNGIHPLTLKQVPPSSSSQPIDTFNGNIVFVPISTAADLGGIDGGFSHALADIDYGFRLKRHGTTISLLPGFLGVCERDHRPPEHLSLLAQWRLHIGIKGGGEPRSIQRILKRQKPMSWPIFMAVSYSMWWVRALHRKFSGRNEYKKP